MKKQLTEKEKIKKSSLPDDKKQELLKSLKEKEKGSQKPFSK